MTRIHGDAHPDCAEHLVDLADVHRKRGNFDAALATYERAARIVRATRGPDVSLDEIFNIIIITICSTSKR